MGAQVDETTVTVGPKQGALTGQKTKPFFDVMEVQCYAPATRKETCPGAISVLAATSSSGRIPRIRDALLDGQVTLSEAVPRKIYSNSLCDCESLPDFTAEIQISYRGWRLLSLIFQSRPFLYSSEVPFCGDTLSHHDFAVSFISSGANPDIDVLVVIRSPVRSLLEQELTRQAPVDLSEMENYLSLQSNPSLMVMDGGWAIGGYLANIAARKMQHRWREHDAMSSSRPCHRPEETISPSPNLSLPAEVLLEQHVQRLRKKD